MSGPRRRFSSELRAEAVREVIERSRPIADVARSLNVVPQVLGNWVDEYRRSHAEDGQELTVHERSRIRELERRVADLEEENRFLGKAAAFFAQKRP